jgi:tetratricopeptide (TPR) repeat protein
MRLFQEADMSRRTRAACAAAALAALLAVQQTVVRANGVPAPAPAPRANTPEEMAVVAYNAGLENRKRAMKAEDQAEKDSKDADRSKNEKKAREEYEKAFKSFKRAADLNPSLPQAWNGMGFAYRKLGDYAKALESYDRALQLAPNFPDAIEYRGEAYLALNRIDDAKQAYLSLFAVDRKQAELLMKAMSGWVAKRKADPGGVDPAAVSALEEWVKERAAIAQQTRLMARDTVARSW